MTFKIDASGNILDGWDSLPPSTVPTESSPKIVLTGTDTAETDGQNTATLTGTVKSGATATLTVSGFTAAGTGGALSYEWYKGATKLTNAGVFSGTETTALTITGYTNTNAGAYTCKVFNTETGKGATIATTIPSATLSTVKNSQATLNAPTQASKSDTSVTLNAATGGSGSGAVTYSKNTTDNAPADGWQSGLTFDGLSANTTYYFFARKAADADYEAATSDSLNVTTDKTAIEGTIAITGTPKVGQDLTLTKTGVNDSSATIKWYTDTDTDATGGSAIGGQTTATYSPVAGDIGKYIYADLTASASYSGGPLKTAAVGPVTAKPTLTAANVSAKYGTTGTITITMDSNDLADAFNAEGGTFAITKTDAKGLITTLGSAVWVPGSHHWTVDVTMAAYEATKVDQTATVHITANAVANKFEASAVKDVTVTYVDKTPLTITGTAAQTVTYNGSAQAFVAGTVTGSGALVQDDANGYEVKYYDVNGENMTTTAPTNAGTYNVVIAPKGTETANYKEIGSPTNSAYTLTIDRKALTWKSSTVGMSSLDKVYDGTRTAHVGATLDETANTYLDGVASGDQTNVKLTIAAGNYAEAYAAADVADQDVTLPTTALSLTGTGADNYTLPGSGTGIKAAISQATPTFQIAEDGTRVALTAAKAGATPQVSLDGGTAWKPLADLGLALGTSGVGKVQLAYWVATPAVELIHCDCGYGNAQGHLPTCAGVTGSDVSLCDCATLAGGNTSGSATSSTAIGSVHTAGCAYTLNPTTGKCDCGLGDSDSVNVVSGTHDWAGAGTTSLACSYADAIPAGGSWVSYGSADAYLSGLAVGNTVKVKIYMATSNTNLAAVADPGAAEANATGTFEVTADPVISGGGGGVSSYTVTYNVGEHGKLAEGAKKTENVNYKKSPSKVPEVIANEGYKFLGWSLDGKTVVDPTAEIITKSITFTALYEENSKSLAFEKTITEPYIKGIEENGELLFKPEAPMTRGEVAVMLARTLNLKMDATKDYATGKFPDLKGDEWYAQAVGYLAELGVMKGLEDGTCAAEKYITRAEFVALVMRIDGIVSGENSFPDVSADNWATDYITAASAKGYVDGNEYGNFLPGADITRASVVKIMNNILGWTEKASGEMLFSDVAGEHWAYGDIVKASTGK